MGARVSTRRLGTWTVAEVCDEPHVVAVETKYRLKEDDLIFDDRYEPITTLVGIPDCSALTQEVQATQVGTSRTIDERGEWLDLVNVNGDVNSELYVNHSLILTYR
jgi:hypothetical protein